MAALAVALQSATGLAQQPSWQPSRIPASSHGQPLNGPLESTASGSTFAPVSGDAEQLGTAVVLRWKSASAAPTTNAMPQAASSIFSQSTSQPARQGLPPSQNPLRSQVRSVAYQQEEQNPFPLPLGGDAMRPPTLPDTGSQLPSLPDSSRSSPPTFPDFGTPQNSLPSAPGNGVQADPLTTPELPPPPSARPGQFGNQNSILETPPERSPFPPRSGETSPRDRADVELLPPPGDADALSRPGDELQRRVEDTNSASCDDLRARTRNPITAVKLDISPNYGEGLRAQRKTAEQLRLDFAASAESREWTDYRGYIVATGRLIDLRDGRVVIDVGGAERTIPFINLSDIDVAYVGESWNIPEKCGTGYEPLLGRNFVASTVQWKASGLCHKPLYFEQVQLERYGHELGPVLQPLVSTAHFFGNIPVLPYKMGIHPPNECQHPLGYFRPGSCAPYMIPPVPLSLRGAAVQAGFVTGAAALIP